jgi:Uma2 family endonuclease
MNIPLRPTPLPLEPGDRLTRDEFERRYEAMPQVKKAELIDGEVFMPSPVSWEFHGSPHVDVTTWLAVYKASTPGTDAGDNSTVRLDTDNEPQPDAALIVRPEHGGRVTFDADGYLNGSPDLVAEISASTASIDLNSKLNVYRRNQVQEYVVWRVYDAAVDWFVFRAGQFAPLVPDPADGLLKSETFPGLWLDATALVRRDLAAVLAAVTRGLASPEHAAFARQLAARRQAP